MEVRVVMIFFLSVETLYLGVMVKMMLTVMVVLIPMVVTALMVAMEVAYSRPYLQC